MRPRVQKLARHELARRAAFAHVAQSVSGRPVHAVQVGANDGQIADPLFHFFLHHEWHGLLLEPNPVYAQRVEQLHAERDHVRIRRVGCSNRDAEMTLFHLNPEFEDQYRTDAQGCATLDRARMIDALAKEKQPVLDEHVVGTTVQLRRLDDILAEDGISTTDVLVIDVEGHEPEVLAGFDLASLSPKLVVVEQNTRATRAAIYDAMEKAGYQTQKMGDDLYGFSDDYADKDAVLRVLELAANWV